MLIGGTDHALVLGMTSTTTLTRGHDTITLSIAEGDEMATVRDADGGVSQEEKDVVEIYIRHRIAEGYVAS